MESLRTPLLALSVILGTLAVYSPAMDGGFLWDDDDYVAENRTLREPGGLRRIWFEPGAVPQYYPVVHTSYWLEYRLWGLRTRGYHLTNVLLHGLCAVLLALLLSRLGVPAPWLAAALFAFHPVQAESVAWITERKNVLSGAFYLAAALSYLRFLGPPGQGRPAGGRPFYFAALGLFLCALLSKTVTASLPAALALALWWKRGRVGRGEILRLLPFFAAALPLCLLTSRMERLHVGAGGPGWEMGLPERALIAGRALWFYLGKLAWPSGLAFIYPRWELDPRARLQYLFPASFLALLALLWLARRVLGRGPLSALLFFSGTLLPALGFFDFYPMRFSFVADHFQYLASIGPLAALAAGMGLFEERSPGLSRALACALLLALAASTWRRAGVFRDLETLWLDTLEKNPSCWMAHDNLANLLVKEGRGEEALRLYQEALRLKPDYAEARNNLGVLLSRQGRLSEAEAQLREALRLAPGHAKARNNLGAVLFRRGDVPGAVSSFREALRLAPDLKDAQANLEAASRSLPASSLPRRNKP